MGIDSANQVAPGIEARLQPIGLLRRHSREIGLPFIVALMVVVFSFSSDVFLSGPNFRNIGVSAAALAAVSFGQTFAILTAGLDLSVGATVALVSIVGALVMRNYGIAPGLLASLAT